MTKECAKSEKDVQKLCLQKGLKIQRLLGRGAFSTVYLVQHEASGRHFALKSLAPFGNPAHASNEIKLLSSIGGRNNVVQLFAFTRVDDHVLFLLEFIDFDDFSTVAKTILRHEAKLYMYNLLSSLKYIHQQGIIHRDIKPSNFLYSRKLKRYALIDFGLALSNKSTSQHRSMLNNSTACTNSQERKPNCQAVGSCSCSITEGLVCNACMKRPKPGINVTGTVGYRAPEIIIYAANSTAPAIDIWAAGVIFLCLLSHHYPFWVPEDDLASLAQIFAMLGTDAVSIAAKRMRREVQSSVYYPPLNMAKICSFLANGDIGSIAADTKENSCNKCAAGSPPGVHRKSNDFKIYALLYAMLQPDPEKRISAEEALNSRYFRSITQANEERGGGEEQNARLP